MFRSDVIDGVLLLILRLVPLIGIFTKLDGRDRIEREKLFRPRAPTATEFRESQAEVEQRTTKFVRELQREVRNLQHPPDGFMSARSAYVRIQGSF